MEAIQQDAPKFSHSSPADTGTLKTSNYKLYRYNNIYNKSTKTDTYVLFGCEFTSAVTKNESLRVSLFQAVLLAEAFANCRRASPAAS